MTWYVGDKPADPPEGMVGFVYLITDKQTLKFYIGKKLLNFTKTKYKTITLKNGNKRKKKIRELNPSDWQDYYGSNEEVKNLVELDPTRFHREIICWCKSKGEMSYWESYYIFINHALIQREWFYNGWVSCKINSSHITKIVI